jgi:hypothetical protein
MSATVVLDEVDVYLGELPSHVVYYVGDSKTGLIKIGCSRNLKSRLSNIGVAAGAGGIPDRRLLACEPGDFALEKDRHKQFRMIREYGEWYRKVPLLMDHVVKVRQLHGIIPLGGQISPWLIAPLVRKTV